MTRRSVGLALWLAAPLILAGVRLQAQEGPGVPHNQDRPPNPALSAAEAASRMTVPPGFTVEVVASEPDLVNPVAMTFDERGRIWVTESLEYPRRSPGPGRDRVKVLEDTDGDGRVDSTSIFAEGLNIPSGIAVGHGGVWVANSPDILFLRDTDGDGKADYREVIVTGFGRDDTHELPNSLSWGPDGWLYGWNGVFNKSHVVHRGKTHDFTCAVFRIHPKTRDFEIFCEGTSNPWGITWDVEGSAFASACVIDHLWHLTESAYYHRQGGPYPPYTWKLGSIVEHSHQKAAYCGIHYYDSDAYPPEYRGKLFMGNIHGNAINVDAIARRGSTYLAHSQPDFLTANDAWFMPVAQKTGPDGSLYILDWYDRYHCYQDANRDPAGIDRLKGRLYRVRYGSTPRRSGLDLGWKSNQELIDLLGSPNGYDREVARRLLTERTATNIDSSLEGVIFDDSSPRRTRLNALWTLISRDGLETRSFLKLLNLNDTGIRSWTVRAAGNRRKVDRAVRDRLKELASDPNPDVRLQVAIAARKVEGLDSIKVLTDVVARSGDDPTIPPVVWQNLHPLLESNGPALIASIDGLGAELRQSSGVRALVPRALDRVLGSTKPDPTLVAGLFRLVVVSPAPDLQAATRAIDAVTERLNGGRGEVNPELRAAVEESLRTHPAGRLADELRLITAYWKAEGARETAERLLLDRNLPQETRLRALSALRASSNEQEATERAVQLLRMPARDVGAEFRARILSALGVFQDPAVASQVLTLYPRFEPDLKPRAIELLTQRAAWAKLLLNAIGAGNIDASALNVNQVRRLIALGDLELNRLVKQRWGVLREGRNPGREAVVETMKRMLRSTPGDPHAGVDVFRRLCAQCHKIYGEGQDVGPEITANGRASFEQLLSNVFDPSLVIGAAYQGTTVATMDGRVLTGLLAEDSPARVVLKLQGGKTEIIRREQVDEIKVSALSLMPEDIERQLTPKEIADLFAYITLDRPPTDPDARRIPGADVLPRPTRPR